MLDKRRWRCPKRTSHPLQEVRFAGIFRIRFPPFFPRATERKTAPPWRERPLPKNIPQQPLRKERTARLGRHRDRGSFRRRRTSFPTPQKRPPEPWPSSLRRGGENEIPCETVGVMAGGDPEDRRPGTNRLKRNAL